MLKCARCGRVFPAPGQSSGGRPRAKPPASDANLSFDFDDDDEWRAPELTSEDLPEDGFLLNVNAEAARPAKSKAKSRPPTVEQPALNFDSELNPDAPDDTTDDEAALEDEAPRDDRLNEPQLRIPDDEPQLRIPDDEPTSVAPAPPPVTRRRPPKAPAAPQRGGSGGIGVRAVFVFLFIVVGAYGALTWSLLDDPDWARRLTQSLPVVGATLRERSAGEDVALIDVEGRYEHTKDGKAVFVITGKAVNRSADSLRRLEILAAVYDGSEHRLDQQITACGNPLEAKIRELSVHQVSILRSIKPPATFGVQPGGQCPFASIFVDVPGNAATFSTEVARAQRNT